MRLSLFSGQPNLYVVFLLMLATGLQTKAQYTNVASANGIALNGRKDGGASFADLNNDGCLDLIINTNNTSGWTRMYFSDCNMPNPTFTDVTSSNAARLLSSTSGNNMERCVIFADVNHDGYIDFAHNTAHEIAIYLNQGPTSSPAYKFGVGSGMTPNFNIWTSNLNDNNPPNGVPNGMNTEGMAWADYNNDGWLDLVIENHNWGMDIYQNPADGTANFTHVTPNGNTLGLPTSATDGDYLTVTDYDNDGDVDILARKTDQFDLFQNLGGTFSAVTSFNEQASNGNKGCVLFADFDNDGDFDLFWSDNGTNQIFTNSAGTFTATNEPQSSSGVSLSGIDGCACGDVDNDGDLDLFLSSTSGTSYLFKNTTTAGTLSFTHSNDGINVNARGQAVTLADYDNDGDLDLYVNVDNAANQLWRNPQNDSNYIMVRALTDIGGGRTRDDVGATMWLTDCFGNVVSGIREVNGGMGHGSQGELNVHFGLPQGRDATYVIKVRYVTKNGSRDTVDYAFYHKPLSNLDFNVTNTMSSDMTACASILPVELVSFEAEPQGNWVRLGWRVAMEKDLTRYIIQRTNDRNEFVTIGELVPSTTNSDGAEYHFNDEDPLAGVNYYRLLEESESGERHTIGYTNAMMSQVVEELSVFPNPSVSRNLQLRLPQTDRPTPIELSNELGQLVWQAVVGGAVESTLRLPEELAAGTYTLRLLSPDGMQTSKLILH